jgi:hypothetical protein
VADEPFYDIGLPCVHAGTRGVTQLYAWKRRVQIQTGEGTKPCDYQGARELSPLTLAKRSIRLARAQRIVSLDPLTKLVWNFARACTSGGGELTHWFSFDPVHWAHFMARAGWLWQ